MAQLSRTTQFVKMAKVLKKHYKSVPFDEQRPVLEHLLFACCLEDAHYEPAEATFATLKETFFDFNEIRVTSIAELSEAMTALPEPRAAANRLKRVLQSVFEATYAFDLEESRKKNLGPTVKWLDQLDGTTKFTVAYVVQSALGGHAIAIDRGALSIMQICDMVTEKDIEAGVVPGLERAISKSKGVEFGSALHQFGADFIANSYAPAVREILLEIDPGCKERLPKRRAAKAAKKKSAAKTVKTDKGKAKKTEDAKAPKAKKSGASSKRKSAAVEKKAAAKGKTASEGLSKRKPR